MPVPDFTAANGSRIDPTISPILTPLVDILGKPEVQDKTTSSGPGGPSTIWTWYAGPHEIVLRTWGPGQRLLTILGREGQNTRGVEWRWSETQQLTDNHRTEGETDFAAANPWVGEHSGITVELTGILAQWAVEEQARNWLVGLPQEDYEVADG